MKKVISFIIILGIFIYTVPFALAVSEPELSAECALLAEPTSGEILYAKNAEQRAYPASVTKIMTVLLALEKGNLSDLVTVSETASEGLHPSGSSVDPALQTGEVLTLEDLLYCAMVASDNKACNVIAEHISGSLDDFIELMNKRAKELGCTGTHFTNAHGLHDENHYTTAMDTYRIALEAVQHETFMTICNTESKSIPATNLVPKERYFYTTNYLISKLKNPNYIYYPATGIKTGHTSKSGYCLVSMAEKNNMILISVVLGSIQDPETKKIGSFTDTVTLFEWGFGNYNWSTIVKKGEPVIENPIKLAEDTDYVMLQTADSIKHVVPKDFDPSTLVKDITLTHPEDLTAPVKKGDVLGSVSYSLDGKQYGTLDLIATNSVERSEALYYAEQVKNFLKQPWVWYTAGGIILALVIYTFFMISHNINRRKKSRVSNYRGRRRRNRRRR